MDKLTFDLDSFRMGHCWCAGIFRQLKVAALMLMGALLLTACGGGGGSGGGGTAGGKSSVAVSQNSAENISSSRISSIASSSSLSEPSSLSSIAVSISSSSLSLSSKSSQGGASLGSASSTSSLSSKVGSSISSASTSVKSSSSTTAKTSSSIVSSSVVSSSVAAPITSIEIAPGKVVLGLGATQQLVAVGRRDDKSLVSLFGKVTWRVASGEAVASVDANGLLKRLTAGNAEIEAKAQGKTVLLKITSDVQNLSLRYDNTEKKWAKVHIYLWTGEGTSKIEPVGKWPGTPMTVEANNLWSYTVNASDLKNGAISVIFNDGVVNGGGGATHQTGNLDAKESGTYNGAWKLNEEVGTTQISVIGGVAAGGGNKYAAGAVINIAADKPVGSSVFNGWTGASAAYIFTDPTKPDAKVVVPNGAESLLVEADFLKQDDLIKSGGKWYAAQCTNCHGANGGGASDAALNGLAAAGDYTVDSLALKIRSSMPKGGVGQCSGDAPGTCAYDIAKLILDGWQPKEPCADEACALDSRNMRLLTTEEYINSLRDIFAMTIDDAVMAPATGDGTSGNFNTASSLALNFDRTLGYQMAAEAIAKQVISNKAFFSLANSCGSDAKCVVASLGKKIFRRTLSNDEINRYSGLYTTADAGKAVIQGLLISPYFMYRSEMGKLDPATNLYKLTPYEVATLLSYSFWASAPDDALLAAADAASANNTSLDIRAQLIRMLGNTSPERERADRGLRRFASGWLINDRYSFSASVSGSLGRTFKEETIRFAMETIKNDLPYKTLLTANYTYANAELAKYYGSSSVASDWAKSTFLDSDPRSGSGILGHGSFLASRVTTATNPSPIKRGLFVRDILMCQHLPPPLKAGVVVERSPGETNRDATKRHTNDPACAGCHQYIDGVGFGFESYGSDARYRLEELLTDGSTKQIDATGSIKSLDSSETRLDADSEAVAYQSVPQLANLIANSNQGAACYSRQFYRYMVGREETAQDENIIPFYSSKVRVGGGMREMLIDLATNPSFILRRKQ